MNELTQAEKRSYRQWCVDMVFEHNWGEDAMISDAEKLYQYIINGTVPDKAGE
jgi:hypothetical protein